MSLTWFGAAVVLALGGVGFAWFHGQSFQASRWVWLALLVIFQWVMLVPHELGHALAGRLLGYGQIRILIGSGKPIFTTELLGIQWLFNIVPFGGLTLAGNPPTAQLRWKEIVFVGGGPMVSLIAAAGTWMFIERGALFDGARTALEAFFWANVIVLAENLFPREVATPFGRLQNDGLLLWNTIFRWGKLPAAGPQAVPRWEIVLCQILKWGVVCVTSGTTLLMGYLAAVMFRDGGSPVSMSVKLFVTGVCVAVMLLAGWITFRIAKQPIAKVRKPESSLLAVRGLEDLQARSNWLKDPRELDQINAHADAGDIGGVFAALEAALKRYPNDVFLLMQKGGYHAVEQKYSHAERAYDEAISSLADANSAAYPSLLTAKLSCGLKQGHIDRVEQGIQEYVGGPAKIMEKIQVIDEVVCADLYEESPLFLPQLERWTRMALELAPGALTLKGTLGSILAEQGNHAEAEPLLRECRTRSTALHDQAFASLYLGKVALSRGEFKAAKELFKQAMILHTEPRLQVKAKRGLEECEKLAGRSAENKR
jgi:tetratricopeptide (TPR) repeat protein